MDQLKRLFESLSLRQRILIGASALGAMLLIYGSVHWETERDFKPLYTNLAPEDAGAVLAKVKETGTPYRLADNGTAVLVPSAKVAEIRLQLASAGIPKSGRIGFEIFDKTNFGASDFTEQVNFHRALEGELERSVMAMSGVDQARVHITFAKDSIFAENREPAKASVLVKLHPGVRLDPQNVQAICQLTASAVEGLSPDAVSVVDMRGGLLSKPRAPGSRDDPAPSPAVLEYRQAVEQMLASKISSTLDPLLGAGNFRTGVSADCDLTSGDQSEETFDPAHSVMTSSQKTEDSTTGFASSGVPGTASSLPRPASKPGGSRGGASRRTETIAYETSRTVRHVRLPQGAIKKLSISVLVDYAVRWQGSGAKAKRIVEPPSSDKIKSIHDLVAAAIGFDAQRGDQLVIESLPFEATLNPEPMPPEPANPAPSSGLESLLRNKNYLYMGAGAVAILVLLGVVAMLFRSRKPAAPAGPRIPARIAASEAAPETGRFDPASDLTRQMEAKLSEQRALREKQTQEALESLKLPAVSTKKTEALSRHIAEEARKSPAVMAHVLRTWLAENES